MEESVAIVTGAGSGIGRAVALKLSKQGRKVVLAGRRSSPLEETANLAKAQSGSCHIVPCDIARPDDVERLFQETVKIFGRLDILFNNAGIVAKPATIDEIPLEDWLQILAINLGGAYLCARQAFGIMRRQTPQGGRIINNGSISAHVPRPGTSPYSVTKHGMTGLTRSLALDGRPFNIACCQIDIGNVETDMAAPMAVGMLQANGTIAPEPTFHIDHVANMVGQIANLPLEVNTPFVTIMATAMPYLGRG